MFSVLLHRELQDAIRPQPNRARSKSQSVPTSEPPAYTPMPEDMYPSPRPSPTRATSSPKSRSPQRIPTLTLSPPPRDPFDDRRPSTSRSPARSLFPTHPFTIHSRTPSLTTGFPRIPLPSSFASSAVAEDYWLHFLDCLDEEIKQRSSLTPARLVNDLHDFVAQWSAEFFEPRGLQVTLRLASPPPSPAFATSPLPSPPLSSETAEFGHLQSSPSFDPHAEPSDGWTSPKAQAASAAQRKVDAKLEKERAKHDKAIEASLRKKAKFEAKQARLEERARKKDAKKGGVSMTRSESAAPGTGVAGDAQQRLWELVVEGL